LLIDLAAHLLFAVLRVELIMSTQLPIAIIHNSTSLALPFFKRMPTIEVVTQFMSKCEPWRACVEFVHTRPCASRAADSANPGETCHTPLAATRGHEMHRWPPIKLAILEFISD
jgi:hypothetical protein